MPYPEQGEQRIAHLDELRGLAVLGMLLINIVGFGLPYQAVVDPSLASAFEGIDKAIFAFTSLLVEGSFRAIFCVLFGMGVLLQFERIAERSGADSALSLHRRRMCWLILFGLIHAYLILWMGDILFLYGLVGLFLLMLRRLSAARLMLIATVLLLLLSVQNLYFGEFIADPKNQLAEPDKLESITPESIRTQMLAEVEADRTAVSAGYLSAWPSRALLALYIQVSYLGRGLWEALALMLIGMALYKWGVHQLKLTMRTYAMIAVAGLVVGLAVNHWELREAADTEVLMMTQVLWTYDLGRIAMATFYASLLMMLCKLDIAPSLRRPLAATGRMALSNYMLQSIICLVLFVGLGYFGALRYYQLYLVVAAIWVFQVWFSSLWLRRFRFGPLEWAWRSLVNRERQPFRHQWE